MRPWRFSTLGALAGLIGLAAAAGAEGPVPTPAPRSYANACATCHDNNGFGVQVLSARLGPDRALLHRGTRLPPAAIVAIVRKGTGAMPPMSRIEVSDSELAQIAAWLAQGPGAR